jgi:hypothetical protein
MLGSYLPQGKVVVEDVEDGGYLLEGGSRGQRRGKGGQGKLSFDRSSAICRSQTQNDGEAYLFSLELASQSSFDLLDRGLSVVLQCSSQPVDLDVLMRCQKGDRPRERVLSDVYLKRGHCEWYMDC